MTGVTAGHVRLRHDAWESRNAIPSSDLREQEKIMTTLKAFGLAMLLSALSLAMMYGNNTLP